MARVVVRPPLTCTLTRSIAQWEILPQQTFIFYFLIMRRLIFLGQYFPFFQFWFLCLHKIVTICSTAQQIYIFYKCNIIIKNGPHKNVKIKLYYLARTVTYVQLLYTECMLRRKKHRSTCTWVPIALTYNV